MATKLDVLKEKHAQLKNRIRLLESKEKRKDRKRETRRKILVGSMVLEMMERDASLKTKVDQGLATWLTRDVDRELFGLSPDASSEREATLVTDAPGRRDGGR